MRKNEEQYFNQLYTESYPLLKRYVFCKAAQNEAEDICRKRIIMHIRISIY